MTTAVATGEFAVRDFADPDYGELVAMHRRDDPTFQWDESDLRRFDRRSAGLVRLVAEGYDPVRGGSRLFGGGMLTAIGGGSRPQRYKLNLVVEPECRRRGIATALKLRTARYARERGYGQIRTWNNSLNDAMLRVNEALAFAKEPVWVSLEKHLGDESRDAAAAPPTHSATAGRG